MGFLREISVSEGTFETESVLEEDGLEDRPAVFHEGARIVLKVNQAIEPSILILPLRNGFPFKVEGRHTPVAEVLSEQGFRAGHALMLEHVGLRVVFQQPSPPGIYTLN